MSKKESCPQCESSQFAVATDKSNKHYCSKCAHVWIPGGGLNGVESRLKTALSENAELRIKCSRLEKKLEALRLHAEDKPDELFE